MAYYAVTYFNELYHWGIKGQKWGRRRFRNEDGTLTPDGKIRYGAPKPIGKPTYVSARKIKRIEEAKGKSKKWGVRRYQNEDGTLTELGKRRIGGGKKDNKVAYDKETGRILDDESKDRAERKIHQQVAQDYQLVGSAANSASNFARTGSSLANRKSQIRQQKAREEAKRKIDVSKMSNKELQDAITRMNLERQYKDLKTSDLAVGRSGVSDILADVGDVLAMAASAASIAYVVYQMKH